MVLIREFEIACGEHYTLGHIRGFLHLYIGQEAVATGVLTAAAEERDYVVTHYRDHGHALAHGLDTGRCMAELFGRSTGLSKGKGGSMHLFDIEKKFMGGHAIVGAHLPLAAGTALAQKHQKTGGVSICFFGDGATGQGVYHETFNLAALWKLPVLFVLENNEFGMGTAIERARAVGNRLRDGLKDTYGIESREVDGMDVLAVREAAIEVIDEIRKGSGPQVIEAKTYRFEGHSLADGEKYREQKSVDARRKKDPLISFPKQLVKDKIATQKEVDKVLADARKEVDEAVKFALESDQPNVEELWDDIYA